MSELSDVLEEAATAEADASGETAETPEPPEKREPMPPVESRFMFVDIAALRAKQLRRGALPRVDLPSADGESDGHESSLKLERIAMREVEEGRIFYELPSADEAEGDAEPGETA